MQMIDSREDILRTNKLEKVTKLTISLNELDNSDNLEDGRPSNTLFTYYVTGPEYSMHFEPHTPQYKKIKNGISWCSQGLHLPNHACSVEHSKWRIRFCNILD